MRPHENRTMLAILKDLNQRLDAVLDLPERKPAGYGRFRIWMSAVGVATATAVYIACAIASGNWLPW